MFPDPLPGHPHFQLDNTLRSVQESPRCSTTLNIIKFFWLERAAETSNGRGELLRVNLFKDSEKQAQTKQMRGRNADIT